MLFVIEGEDGGVVEGQTTEQGQDSSTGSVDGWEGEAGRGGTGPAEGTGAADRGEETEAEGGEQKGESSVREKNRQKKRGEAHGKALLHGHRTKEADGVLLLDRGWSHL